MRASRTFVDPVVPVVPALESHCVYTTDQFNANNNHGFQRRTWHMVPTSLLGQISKAGTRISFEHGCGRGNRCVSFCFLPGAATTRSTRRFARRRWRPPSSATLMHSAPRSRPHHPLARNGHAPTSGLENADRFALFFGPCSMCTRELLGATRLCRRRLNWGEAAA